MRNKGIGPYVMVRESLEVFTPYSSQRFIKCRTLSHRIEEAERQKIKNTNKVLLEFSFKNLE